MNRPIRFRAWDNSKKEMLYPKKAEDMTDKITSASLLAAYNDGGLDSIMQFTGLFDKNGKEIYESDIVKFQMTRTKLVDHPVMTALEDETGIYQGEVVWGEYGWRPFIDGKVENCEVVGNKFENLQKTGKGDIIK